MDYNKIIRELYADKQRLDRVIRQLEQLPAAQQAAGTSLQPRSPRGRKSMGAQERQEVSRLDEELLGEPPQKIVGLNPFCV